MLNFSTMIYPRLCLQMVASYEEAIEKLNEEIDRRMEPYQETSEKLQTIPGVKKNLLKPLLPKLEWI